MEPCVIGRNSWQNLANDRDIRFADIRDVESGTEDEDCAGFMEKLNELGEEAALSILTECIWERIGSIQIVPVILCAIMHVKDFSEFTDQVLESLCGFIASVIEVIDVEELNHAQCRDVFRTSSYLVVHSSILEVGESARDLITNTIAMMNGHMHDVFAKIEIMLFLDACLTASDSDMSDRIIWKVVEGITDPDRESWMVCLDSVRNIAQGSHAPQLLHVFRRMNKKDALLKVMIDRLFSGVECVDWDRVALILSVLVALVNLFEHRDEVMYLARDMRVAQSIACVSVDRRLFLPIALLISGISRFEKMQLHPEFLQIIANMTNLDVDDMTVKEKWALCRMFARIVLNDTDENVVAITQMANMDIIMCCLGDIYENSDDDEMVQEADQVREKLAQLLH